MFPEVTLSLLPHHRRPKRESNCHRKHTLDGQQARLSWLEGLADGLGFGTGAAGCTVPAGTAGVVFGTAWVVLGTAFATTLAAGFATALLPVLAKEAIFLPPKLAKRDATPSSSSPKPSSSTLSEGSAGCS